MQEMYDDNKVRNYVRYGFAGMVLMFAIMAIFNITSIIYSLVLIGVTIFCFANSIRHLIKYEEKLFAIISVVLSGFLLLLTLVGIVVGFIKASARV